MSARFRVLRSSMELHPKNINIVVQACCVLHNFCLEKELQNYGINENDIENEIVDDVDVTEGEINDDVIENQNEAGAIQLSQRAQRQHIEGIRIEHMEYFTRVDELPWQYNN